MSIEIVKNMLINLDYAEVLVKKNNKLYRLSSIIASLENQGLIFSASDLDDNGEDCNDGH